MRNDPEIPVGLVVGLVLFMLLCFGGLFIFVNSIENHPDHMTEFEKAATIKRIEKKLDTLLEK